MNIYKSLVPIVISVIAASSVCMAEDPSSMKSLDQSSINAILDSDSAAKMEDHRMRIEEPMFPGDLVTMKVIEREDEESDIGECENEQSREQRAMFAAINVELTR